MAVVEPAKTGMVICVSAPTDADCWADRVTFTGSGFIELEEEVTVLESATGLPGGVELPVTGTSGILPRLAVAGTPKVTVAAYVVVVPEVVTVASATTS